ncbi:DEAD/DEAH box helicase [Rubrivivax sp. RP6-9]|uniref:DEAD/DEAH box helicase n=1 Tax=Rubrivivax sp. RP6-9 TaxID=3415750 RepID=UPI003CC5B0B3
MRAAPGFGPRGAQLTVALLPAGADVAARDTLVRLRLAPLPAKALQWRTREAAAALQQGAELWSLAEEAHWSDFWAEQVPRLRAAGWQLVVDPGFAHFSLPVQRWKLHLDGTRTLAALGTPDQPLARLRGAHDQGSWRMSLGVEVDGETLDLAPLLAGLLARDRRWLHADRLLEIDDAEIVVLRAPGGRRIEAPAAPLKAIVGAMLDLLVDARSPTGPIPLSAWDAERAEALREELAASMAQRAGALGAWQLQGDTGLQTLVQRLRAAGTPPPVDPPPGLGLTLRPYQLQGLAWLQYLRAQGLAGILADDMGLGKTAQVLAHVLAEHAAGRLDRPALVVLPTSLIANWQAEAARVAPGLRVLVLHGARRDFTAIAQHDLVLTTYPLLWRDSRELGAQPWHLLVLDEAQMAKNAGSRAARALRRLDARHRLCVTGTPLENHLGELWTHFDLLMPGFLGDSRTFARLWRRPIEDNGETQRAALLARRVRPFILRRRKHEVAPELPPLTEVLRRVPLEGTQRALYESVRAVVDEQVRRTLDRQGFRNAQIAVLDALLKLRQVCCDPRLVTGPQAGRPTSAKLDLLLQMLPALVADGRRVLVFSQFSTLLGLVAQALQQIALPHLLFTGDTPPAQRGETVRRFQAREVPVLLLSLKAGGVGLNLTAADTVVHLDPWWNPAVEDQATARAHRIGQDQPVLVYRIVAAGSIEERMLALQARKAALAAGVLGSDAAGDAATKFDEADLRGLLAPLEDT